MKRASIRRRLLGAYALVLALIILLFGTALVWGLNHSFETQLQNGLESVVYDLKHDIMTQPPVTPGMLDPKEEYALSPVYIEVWEVGGAAPRRLLYSANMGERHLPLREKAMASFVLYTLPSVSKKGQTALLSTAVAVGKRRFVITAATPIDKPDSVVGDFIQLFALFGAILYLIALSLGARLLNQVLSPMKSITDAAAGISHGDLSQRVPLPAIRDEFYTLAETFNAMLERIEKAFENMKLFNANVSHELKTPLTIVRGEAEVALRKERDPAFYGEVLRSIMEETASMQRIIEGMLLLSRSDGESLRSRMVPVRLDAIVDDAYRQQKPFAEAKGITMTLMHSEPAEVRGEPQLLREALNNLLDNAVKYTPGGKHITIELRREVQRVEVIIADEGVGIESDALAKIFDPFWREDTAHSKAMPGHGLGLSIVRWIMQAHHGSINIDSEKNRGTQCVLIFFQT